MDAQELPLFPLNVVLFPEMLLPLHIFEERYKQMMDECLEGNRIFGVVLARGGGKRSRSERPESVGTTAYIQEVQRLPEGRLNLLAVGQERFRILRLTQERPFLRAEVEFLSDLPEDPASLTPLVEGVTEQAQEYFRLSLSLSWHRPREVLLPSEPELLSFAIAGQLQIEVEERQRLLELTSTRERLEELAGILARENEKLGEELERRLRRRGNGQDDHSLLPRPGEE